MKNWDVASLSTAVWILISVGDYILNNNIYVRLTGIDLFNIFYNVIIPITIATVLAIYEKKVDYFWWVSLPLFSGFEDIICIGTDWLMGYPTPNNFMWLHNQPLIESFRNIFGHITINMGTLFLGFLTAIAICIILSKTAEKLNLSHSFNNFLFNFIYNNRSHRRSHRNK